jgi:hypothetical protein
MLELTRIIIHERNPAKCLAGTVAHLGKYTAAMVGPIPRMGHPVGVGLCSCAGDVSVEDMSGLADAAMAALLPPQRIRAQQVADGEPLLDPDGVLAVLGIKSNTTLNALIKAKRFPPGLQRGNGRVWLKSETLAAAARIIDEDTTTEKVRIASNKHRPTNRYEIRAMAAKRRKR